jgi:hypothetical protein
MFRTIAGLLQLAEIVFRVFKLDLDLSDPVFGFLNLLFLSSYQ